VGVGRRRSDTHRPASGQRAPADASSPDRRPGFNVYRVLRRRPPPAPWTRFWPRGGGVAVARNQGGCHNELRRTNFSACIIGTFFYGESAALLRLAQLFFARARRYVLRMASPGYAGPKLLCADQDMLEEAVAHEPSLVEEFQVSQREFFGWGWAPPDKQSDNETRPSRRGECAAQDHAPGKVMCQQSHLLLRARRHAKLSKT